MSNKIISYSNLKGEVKNAFKNWLQVREPELVSFPFKGQHVKGYVFDYEKCKYLVIMYLANQMPDYFDVSMIDDDF